MVVFVIFTNHWVITIIWKKKKETLPVVQNNMIIQGAEIPLLPLAQQTLKDRGGWEDTKLIWGKNSDLIPYMWCIRCKHVESTWGHLSRIISYKDKQQIKAFPIITLCCMGDNIGVRIISCWSTIEKGLDESQNGIMQFESLV